MSGGIIKSNDPVKDFMAEFECPICNKYIYPPIRQCLSGHCFCHSCFENIQNCSVCRAPKTNSRCMLLEKIHALLTFPCKYQEEGCDFTGKGDAIKTHHGECGFAAMECPLRIDDCRWRGFQKELVVHCREDHPQNIYFGSKQKLMCAGFTNLTDRKYVIIFHVFGKIFRCIWDFNRHTKLLRYAMYCLEQNVSSSRYSFEVAILNRSSDMEVIRLRGPCYPANANSEGFVDDKYLVAALQVVKSFCNSDGDLNYVIKVISN